MNAKPSKKDLVGQLSEVLGPEGVLTGAAVSTRGAGIWREDSVAAPVIFRPSTTAEVAAVLRACHAARQTDRGFVKSPPVSSPGNEV